MGVITTFHKLDDLDKVSPAKTVKFMLDKKEYEIDLGEDNEARLRRVFAEYLPYARKVKKVKPKAKKVVKPIAEVASDEPSVSQNFTNMYNTPSVTSTYPMIYQTQVTFTE